ncbi:PIN domain-like [Phytophthora cactorum]|nr:PIN domain-like [Phytophthora cactorum]
MGVRGLTRYCRQNEAKTSVEELDLHDVTLAVDFVGFLYYLCEELFSETNASPSWLLLGGCTLRLERYVDTWIKRLRERKVRLVFITDPPQCFGGESHRKGHCLQDRALQKAEQIEQLGQSLEKTLTINTVSSIGQGQTVAVALEAAPSPQQKGKVARTLLQTNGRFPFAREKLRGVLKKHGIGIKTASREADEELGNLVRTGEAFAVLAEDSDFLAMSGVRYIPFGKLSFYEHGQNLEQMRIRARVFSSEMVAESLGLEVKQLVDLALLCGNDFTPLLDNEFDMATMLDFPVQRMQGSLYPTDAARYVTDHMPILENPVLGQIEAKKKGFLRALFEIYRFYGHTAAFLKKFPMKIESILPTKKMKLYKKLIDIYDFPPMAIDILETKARGLSQRFDPLASIPGLEDKSLDDLQAPARRLSYLVLDTPVVEEGTVRSCVQVHVAPLEFLRPLISVPIQGRGANAVERMFRSLMCVLLYGDPSGKKPKAGQLAGMLGGKDKKGVAVKSIVYALLVLWKQDRTYLTNASLLDDRLLELLLVTSLISFAVDSSKRKTTDGDLVVFDEQLLNMEIYSVVGGYLETLKQLHQLRLLLGSKLPANSGCATYFSGELQPPAATSPLPLASPPLPPPLPLASPSHLQTSASTSKSSPVAANPRPPRSDSSSQLDASAPAFNARSVKGLMPSSTLPVFAHREEILENVAANQLTIIQGETGCGKSTSVPQFLYDSWARDKAAFDRPVNIYVTQPRRIAAIELANTVARMREGNEFHEDGQLQLKNHHLRLVIMSATMDAQILIQVPGQGTVDSLGQQETSFVGSKLYPVTNVYLDELANWFPDLWRHCQKEMVLMRDQFRLLSQSHQSANSEWRRRPSRNPREQLIVIEKMVGLLIEASVIKLDRNRSASSSSSLVLEVSIHCTTR